MQFESLDWVNEWVSDLESKMEPFIVGTEELDDELAEIFKSEMIRLLTELQQGVAAHDAEVIREAAHSIKGMGGSMGFPELSVVAHEIELMAKENTLAKLAPLVDALALWVQTFA